VKAGALRNSICPCTPLVYKVNRKQDNVTGSFAEPGSRQDIEDISPRQLGVLDAWVDERMMTLIFRSGEIAILK